jgi:hypothetical protein
MAKRNEIYVTKVGRELLGKKMLMDRETTFGSQDALLEHFEEIFKFKFPKSTLARFAKFSSLRGKPFLVNHNSRKPFSYGELMEILAEELNPITGERSFYGDKIDLMLV